jgi:hypothetical protein
VEAEVLPEVIVNGLEYGEGPEPVGKVVPDISTTILNGTVVVFPLAS